MDASLKCRIEAATLTVETKARGTGRGVLVNGGFILTAAHCVDCAFEGEMILGDHYLQTVVSKDGKRLKVSPVAVDPCTDFAVFGTPDRQRLSEDADAFETFCDETEPLSISSRQYELFSKIPVSVYSHRNEWLVGSGMLCGSAFTVPFINVELTPHVEHGTSGSAVVNSEGEVEGIISNLSDTIDEPARSPRPRWALPAWLLEQIGGTDVPAE